MPILLNTLVAHCDALLQAPRFKDYCPNGLQLEGAAHISRLALAVTANLAAIEAAVAWGAQALLVHHGLMWRGDDGRVTGYRQARLKAALAADLSIIAYHLPLDAHPELGNNVMLGRALGLNEPQPLHCPQAPDGLLYEAALPTPRSAAQFAAHVALVLGRDVQLIGDANASLSRIVWCTGGGGSYFEAAIAAGAQAFITGEANEQHVHTARECGVPLLLAGHHATERYGVQALGAALAAQHGLDVQYFEVDSPL